MVATNQVGRRRVNGPPRGTGGSSSGAARTLAVSASVASSPSLDPPVPRPEGSQQ